MSGSPDSLNEERIYQLFEQDIQNHTRQYQELARFVYAECLKFGYPYIRHSKEKNKDGETIFKHAETHVYFLVINTKNKRIKLVTEDKIGFVDAGEFGFEAMARTQGERKKGLQVILKDSLDDLIRQKLSDLVAQCAHANRAYQLAKGQRNSTDYYRIMFGEASGDLKSPFFLLTNELLEGAYHERQGACIVCGSRDNLELYHNEKLWLLYCFSCHPHGSIHAGIAGKAIPYEVRRIVWYRDRGCCHVPGCRSRLDNIQFDHVIPRLHGGSNTENNITLKCRSHNLRKSGKLVYWV